MGKFLESEKPRQVDFKAHSKYFSLEAKEEGVYKGKPRPFCLPRSYADENLCKEIRKPISAYFAKNRIKWHDGQDGKPSNHMCDSQVCCANFLFPFYNQPEALAALLRPYYPDLKQMFPIEDGQYVAFEWIGKDNYLREISHNRVRTRGANYTSADAAVKFIREDNTLQVVLIEWKYTESYYPTSLKIAPSQRDRTEIYKHLYDEAESPINHQTLPGFDSLFYEPFYQLMRQQFLAHKMEKAHELGADTVSLLHIAPRHNQDFTRVTSPNLHTLGSSPTEVWKKLVIQPDRFQSVYTEELFGKFDVDQFSLLGGWWDYISSRYWWLLD
jgi:hypothetical protein